MLSHTTGEFPSQPFRIVLCWNLDWRHYIRYWLRRPLPHMCYWEIGFIAPFAAYLIGAAIHLAQEGGGNDQQRYESKSAC